MILKRLLICLLIIFAITIINWAFLSIGYKSIDPGKWPEFAKGFFAAMNMFGIPTGLIIVAELFKKPKLKKKHLR